MLIDQEIYDKLAPNTNQQAVLIIIIIIRPSASFLSFLTGLNETYFFSVYFPMLTYTLFTL